MGLILILIVIALAIYIIGPLLIVALVVGGILGVLYVIYRIFKDIGESVELSTEEKRREKIKNIEKKLQEKIERYQEDINTIDNVLNNYIYTKNVADLLNACIEKDGGDELKIYIEQTLILNNGLQVDGIHINALESKRDDEYNEKKVLEEELASLPHISAYRLEELHKSTFPEIYVKKEKDL